MTFALEAVRYKPVALWVLDDTSPFQDYSGYAAVATSNTTPDKYMSLVSGASFASVFDTGTIGTFASPVFTQDHETQAFSLSVSLRIVERDSGTEQICVLSHASQTDGIVIEGTKIHFSTKYLGTGEARATYDIQIPRHVDIVAVHTAQKNSLYVDGEMVAEAEISDAQQADRYITTDGSLYAGTTTGDNGVALSGVAIYAKALSDDDIARLASVSRDVVDSLAVPEMFGGEVLETSQNPFDVFSEQIWTTEDDWNTGTLRNIVVADEQLQPSIQDDVVQYGEWLDTFSLSDTGLTSIYGVNFNWVGIGAVVEASLDSTTWEEVTRGKNVDLIAPGFDPTDVELFIRVSFPDTADPDSYLDTLSIVGIETGAGTTTAGRVITTGSPSYLRKSHPANELRDDWGTALLSATLTIGADTSDTAESVQTREYWIKKLDTGSITLTPAAGTTYVNGVAAAFSTIRVGEWVLIHSVPASPLTSSFTLNGNILVGQAAVYQDVLDATDVLDVYKAYTGQISTPVVDDSDIILTETAVASNIYAHDWAISPAG